MLKASLDPTPTNLKTKNCLEIVSLVLHLKMANINDSACYKWKANDLTKASNSPLMARIRPDLCDRLFIETTRFIQRMAPIPFNQGL